jgi:hypothetical protein
MSKELNTALLAQIDKHLPQMVGKQLRERLELADKADEALAACESYAKKNSDLIGDIRKLRESDIEREREAQRLKNLHYGLDTREQALALKELEMKLRIEHAQNMMSFVDRTVANVFKNREVVTTMTGNVPAGVVPRDQYGNGGYPLMAAVNSTTSTEG